jgi:hypothetical protein
LAQRIELVTYIGHCGSSNSQRSQCEKRKEFHGLSFSVHTTGHFGRALVCHLT